MVSENVVIHGVIVSTTEGKPVYTEHTKPPWVIIYYSPQRQNEEHRTVHSSAILRGLEETTGFLIGGSHPRARLWFGDVQTELLLLSRTLVDSDDKNVRLGQRQRPTPSGSKSIHTKSSNNSKRRLITTSISR